MSGRSFSKLTAMLIGSMVYVITLTAMAQSETVPEKNDLMARQGVVVTTSIASAPLDPFNFITPGLSIGYKTKHIVASIGLRISLQNTELTFTPMAIDATTQHREITSGFVLLCPSLQASFVQWPKANLEFIGQFAAGLGPISGGSSVFFELYVAPGIRGWPHKNFAVTGTVGPELVLGIRAPPVSPRAELQFLALF